jgi:diguanylate cyclase (GGDEF)-like protein
VAHGGDLGRAVPVLTGHPSASGGAPQGVKAAGRRADARRVPSFRDATELVVRTLGQEFEGSQVWIGHLDRDNEVLRVVATGGNMTIGLEPGMEAPIEDSFCHHLAAGAASIANDVPSDPSYGLLPGVQALGIRSFTGVALRLPDGTAVGTICAFHRNHGAYGQRELGLLATFGTLLARDIAAQRRGATLHQILADLRKQATTDPLTGVANRRAFHVALNRALRRRRPGDAVAIVDIDSFKAINDAHGHLAGDAALIGVAGALATPGARRTHVGRLGGDEFAVVLTGREAATWRERAEARIADLSGELGHPVTVSIGMAPLEHAANADEVLQHADDALYAAKRGLLTIV